MKPSTPTSKPATASTSKGPSQSTGKPASPATGAKPQGVKR